VTDFGQGMLSSPTLKTLCSLLRPCTPLLAGDVSGRRSQLLSMRQMDLLCPSEQELREAVHDFDGSLSTVVANVLQKTDSRNAIITLGAEGAIAFAQPHDDKDQTARNPQRLRADHIPAFTAHAVDQLGCGDALLAAATMTMASGGSLAMASIIGNIAAAAQAGRMGNAVIGAAELRRGAARLGQAQLNYEPQPLATVAAM
jgi:sugar/nucleoside kinase (ribokinase family)